MTKRPSALRYEAVSDGLQARLRRIGAVALGLPLEGIVACDAAHGANAPGIVVDDAVLTTVSVRGCDKDRAGAKVIGRLGG